MDSQALSGAGEHDRYPCGSCGRKFYQEALAKHERICKTNKLKSQKRKVFNSGKQRAVGSDVPLKNKVKPGQTQEKGVKITNWRQNHLDFVNAIRGARSVQVAIKTGAPLPPPPPPSINPDFVPCPHCSRRFNAKAGARHIPFCQQRTKTYGEPIKPLSKRAAADLGGSKTGRGKAYYQKTIRGKEASQRRANSDAPAYPSAYGGGRVHADDSLRAGPPPQTPTRSYRPTTSPRRRIVSTSGAPSGATPSSHGSGTPVRTARPPDERPATGSLRKYTRNRTAKANVRFSDNVQTYPSSHGGTPGEPNNVAVVQPYKTKRALASHGNDSHARTSQRSGSSAGMSRDQVRKERIGGSRQSSDYERTTPVSFNNSSSFNSSGYSSDRSPRGASPLGGDSPAGSPRLQAAGDRGGQGSLKYTRESSFVKRANSVVASFCHDCGTQYPTSTSKFCCNCGMQRAFITPR